MADENSRDVGVVPPKAQNLGGGRLTDLTTGKTTPILSHGVAVETPELYEMLAGQLTV